MKKTLSLIAVSMVVSGVGLAKNLDTGYEPEGLDDLAKQKGIFKTTLVRPDADFSRYTKLNSRKVMLIVRDSGPQTELQETGSLIGSRSSGGVMPEWEELAELKEIINDTILTELAGSTELEIVDLYDSETLVLRPAITDVVFDRTSKVKTPDGKPAPVLSQGTIIFDLIDGETGIIQARVGERRKCRLPKGSASFTDDVGPWTSAATWTEVAVTDLCRVVAELTKAASTP